MLARLASTAFLLASLAGTAAAQEAVRVHIPTGIASGFAIVEPGPDASRKYVVIENIIVRNPTGNVVAYKATDFSLVAGDARYHPVARPKLSAIDISQDGVLGPHDTLRGNLAFLVPATVTKGNLEFLPANWIDRQGNSLNYCCLP